MCGTEVPCGRGCDKNGARPVNGICGTYFADESYVMHAPVRREGATKTEASTEADVMSAVESRGRGCELLSGRPSSRTMTLLELRKTGRCEPWRRRTQNSEEGFCLSDRQTATRREQGQARERHPSTGHASKSEPQDPGGKKGGEEREEAGPGVGPGL